ncbi:hypothetical protein GZL_04771 [Streptomyces sp. 769]|nr:hypothetical protein GZL_04771 [Streptomyces sp. 769]
MFHVKRRAGEHLATRRPLRHREHRGPNRLPAPVPNWPEHHASCIVALRVAAASRVDIPDNFAIRHIEHAIRHFRTMRGIKTRPANGHVVPF